MIPKLKVETRNSSMNSTKVVILINGTVNTIAKIQTDANQKPGDTNFYYSLEWIKHQEKRSKAVTSKLAVDTKTDV